MKFDNKKTKWFPGHMNLTKNLIKNCVSQVDLVVNLVDARAPMASTNFSILKWIKNRPVVVFLGKSDLADDALTKVWLSYFKNNLNYFTVALNCKNFNNVKKSFNLACSYLRTLKKNKFNSKMIRIMVVGVSNVGKSSLINCLAGSKKLKVENRPGVTKFKQWVFLGDGVSLLDTPGVLPLGDDKSDLQNFFLQILGLVKREEVDVENLVLNLLDFLNNNYPNFFEKSFSGSLSTMENSFEWLKKFAEMKKMILKGGEFDLIRAANFLISGFQSAKYGKFTFEWPNL